MPELRITAWMDEREREDLINDVAAKVAGAPKGAQFTYRGLTIEKRLDQSRGGLDVRVYDMDGEVAIDSLDLRKRRTAALVEELDAVREASV